MTPVAQLDLFAGDKMGASTKLNGTANKLAVSDRRFHNWYRFVLSFPPHLVREYLARFGLKEGALILDPFCGTGTTLVEAKLHGLNSVGVEANPMAHFASSVKVDWQADAEGLIKHAALIASAASRI